MACRPKLPTGEKKPPKFQAPIFVPAGNSADLQRMLASAFSNIAADLEGLHNITDTPPLTTPVTAVAGVVFARAGDVLRLQPGPAGIQVLLPAARATNKGNDVSIIVQNATGTVTVRATEGRVQGVASVVLSGDGLRVFRSDGGDGTATGAGGWWIVGRNSADSTAAFVGVSAGTTSLGSGILNFSNSNGVAFGLNGSVLTANFSAIKSISLVQMAASQSASITNATDLTASGPTLVLPHLITFFNTSQSFANVSWRISGNTLLAAAHMSMLAGVSNVPAQAMSFADSNGVSFGAQSTTFAGFGAVAFLTANYARELGLVSHVGGNVQSSATRLAFSNASGVTWSLSTAANAATVLASVNDQSLGMVSHIGVDSVRSVTRMAFANVGNFAWSMLTGASAATLSGLVTAVAVGAGVQQANTGTVSFINSNNFTFGMAGFSAITASFSETPQTFVGAIAGGTQTATSGTIVFSNSNDFTFGMSGSTRMTVSYLPQIGLVSHIGGNVVSSVTRLAFSNASNVTFSLSTAANAATLLASVNAGGGGGVAISQGTGIATSGTVNFSNNSILTAGAASASLNNVVFDLATDQIMRATAIMRVTDGTNSTQTGGFQVTKLMFKDSPGITFGLDSTNDAQGRVAVVTAKLADVTHWRNWEAGQEVGGVEPLLNFNSTLHLFPLGAGPFPGNMTVSTLDILMSGNTTNNSLASWALTCRGAIYTLANSTQLSMVNSFSSTIGSASLSSTQSSLLNNMFGGDRWFTIHSSQWSAQPVLSAGVQYWMALNWSTANTLAIQGWPFIRQLPSPGLFNGIMNSSQAAAVGRGFVPFLGQINTGSPNATIGGLLTTTGGQPMGYNLVQFRNGIALGL